MGNSYGGIRVYLDKGLDSLGLPCEWRGEYFDGCLVRGKRVPGGLTLWTEKASARV